MTAAPPPEWTDDRQAPLRRPGKRRLWQGAAQPGLHQPGKRPFLVIFGPTVPPGGLAPFATALRQPAPPGSADRGLSRFAPAFADIDAVPTLGPLIAARHDATRLHHALTGRAADVRSRLVTDRAQVHPTLPATHLDLAPRLGSVRFHPRRARDGKSDATVGHTGFRNIGQPQKPIHLIRDRQEGAA